MGLVNTPPRTLPAANSAKWHERQRWDRLGYFRVRTLANPAWPREPDYVRIHLKSARPFQEGPERDFIDAALQALHDYQKLDRLRSSRGHSRRTEAKDECWDRALAAIDGFLDLRHA